MGHWYDQSGKACHTIRKGVVVRDTTLRDARALNLVPSVSEVLSIIAKPGLEVWKSNQTMLASLTLPKIIGEDEATYLSRIRSDSRKQAQEAANEGTRIHAAVEKWFLGQSVPTEYWPHVSATRDALQDMFPDVHDWVSEKSFAHPLGFGGCSDLHSPSTGIVVDFKSTDKKRDSGKRLHYDQNYQLAAYQVGLRLTSPSTCANVFIGRTEPGTTFSHIWKPEEIQQGWRVFQSALNLWKAVKGYTGEW
jgi:hypothetical protein